jgi:hypothetical protein
MPMVLGLTRPRTRLGGAVAGSYDRAHRAPDGRRHWHAERGEILFEASCDVFGGFPGFAVRGGRLFGQRLRVSERYLLVGDGDEQGFGLAIGDVDGVALVPLPDGDESGLRVFYQDAASPRLFTVRFHGNRLSMRSGPRAERAHLSLLRAGLVDRFGIAHPPEPAYVVSWDETAEFEAENVIWTGRATVPRHIGLDGVPGNVWLTTRSLIWGCESVAGVHRVPLPVLTDVAAATVADRTGTPAVYVGLGDESSGHFDLAFLFDQQSTADHNLRERGAMLVGLRSRGIPVGSPTPPFQPWRRVAPPAGQDPEDVAHLEPDDDSAIDPWHMDQAIRQSPSRRRLGTFDLAGAAAWDPAPPDHAAGPLHEPVGDETMDAPVGPSPRLLDVVLAEWSALPDDDRDRRADDVQVAASWLSPLPPGADQAASAAPVQTEDDDPSGALASPPSPATMASDDAAAEARSQQTEAPDVSVCWPRATAYESAAVEALAETLAAIRDRGEGRVTPLAASIPTPADQSAALAELAALSQTGIVTPDELRGRSDRILALGDACVRLRTLLELRDAGHVSDDDLARRQQSITAQLAGVIEVR